MLEHLLIKVVNWIFAFVGLVVFIVLLWAIFQMPFAQHILGLGGAIFVFFIGVPLLVKWGAGRVSCSLERRQPSFRKQPPSRWN